mgnify:CR=1 FL=1
MTIAKSKKYLNDLRKAENWLSNYIAKATEGVDPKDAGLMRHKIKQAEIALFQTNKVKGVPKELSKFFSQREKQNPIVGLGKTILNIPKHLDANLLKSSRDLRIRSNQARLARGQQPIYVGDKAPQTVTRPVNPAYTFDRTNLATLLNGLVQERYAVEDLIGSRGTDNIDYKLLSRMGITNFNPIDGVNPLYDGEHDVITHAKRIKSERDTRQKLYKGNDDYGSAWWKTGTSYKSLFNKESPNYTAKTASSGKALSISERQAYDPDRLVDASMGNKYWSGRGSGRSFKQANQDTRALLIDDYGASAADVNRLSNDVLSRFRISGHLAKTDTNLQLLQDGGGSINLKLNRNSLSTPSGAVYEGSNPTKTNKTESKSNRSFLGFTRIKDDKGKNVPLHETFSDPL